MSYRIDKIQLEDEKDFIKYLLTLKDWSIIIDDNLSDAEYSPTEISPEFFSPYAYSPFVDSKQIVETINRSENIAYFFKENNIRVEIDYNDPFFIYINIYDIDYSPFFLIKKIEVESTETGKTYNDTFLKLGKLFKRVKEDFYIKIYKELKENNSDGD